jgi:transposase, IS5 family
LCKQYLSFFLYIMAFTTSFLWARMQSVQTRGMKFLDEMEKVIPRNELLVLVEQNMKRYKVGRPKYSSLLLLKIYFLQQWYNLSDPWAEDAIYDRASFLKFLDLDLLADKVPDETTILNFRHFLEEHKIQEKIFRKINEILEKKWILLKEGTTVDATIIHAPSSTKNNDGKRDPEMHSTRKGNQRYFWAKAHIGTDRDSGCVHSLEFTSANTHDSTMLEKLEHGEEKELYWDSAYHSMSQLWKHLNRWVLFSVCSKGNRNKALTQYEKTINRIYSQVRSKVEHIFWVIKHLWWHKKVRYRWIEKNHLQRYTLCWLANIYKMRKLLI